MRAALIGLALAAGASAPARADFFDDVRRTFTKDIPRTFEQDIPRAFGANPRKTPEPARVRGKPAPEPRPTRQ